MTSANKQYPDSWAGASDKLDDALEDFKQVVGQAFTRDVNRIRGLFTLEDDAKVLALKLQPRRRREAYLAKVRRHRKTQVWKGIKAIGFYLLWAIGLVAACSVGWILLIVFATPAGACEDGGPCNPPELCDQPVLIFDSFPFPDILPLGEPVGITDLEPLVEGVRADITTLRPNVDPTWAGELAGLVVEHGNEFNLDLKLVTALIMTESSFRPTAMNPDTFCAGLMQLHPCHEIEDVYDPVINMHWGCLKLRKYIDDRGSVIGGLRRYGTSTASVKYHLEKIGGLEILTE